MLSSASLRQFRFLHVMIHRDDREASRSSASQRAEITCQMENAGRSLPLVILPDLTEGNRPEPRLTGVFKALCLPGKPLLMTRGCAERAPIVITQQVDLSRAQAFSAHRGRDIEGRGEMRSHRFHPGILSRD